MNASDLKSLEKRLREELGIKERTGTFATFDRHHIQLDVASYVKSEEGKKSLAKIWNRTGKSAKSCVR